MQVGGWAGAPMWVAGVWLLSVHGNRAATGAAAAALSLRPNTSLSLLAAPRLAFSPLGMLRVLTQSGCSSTSVQLP